MAIIKKPQKCVRHNYYFIFWLFFVGDVSIIDMDERVLFKAYNNTPFLKTQKYPILFDFFLLLISYHDKKTLTPILGSKYICT